MPVVGAMNGIVGLNVDNFTKGAKQAGKDVDGLSAKFKGFNSMLKSDFGKNSALGQALKLAAGGGAVAALKSLANDIKAAAHEMGDLTLQFVQGKVKGGELVDRIVSAIPVFGQFYEAARTVKEEMYGLATGLKAQMEQYDRMIFRAKQYDKTYAFLSGEIKDSAKRMKDAHAQALEEITQANEKAAASAIDDPVLKQIKETENARAKALRKIDAEAAEKDKSAQIKREQERYKGMKFIDPARDAAKKEVEQLQAEQEQAQKDTEARKQAVIKESEAKIGEIRRTAAEKAAEDAEKDDQDRRKKALEDMQTQYDEELKRLKGERSEILKSANDGGEYKAAQTSQFRGGALIAQYAPQVATKMQQLSEEQRNHLKSIDEQFYKLTGKNPDDEDIAVANF